MNHEPMTRLRHDVLAWDCPRCAATSRRECRTRSGSPRWPHVVRIALGAAYRVFSALAGRLSFDARKDVLLNVTAHDWLGLVEQPQGASVGVTTSPWERQGYAVLTASRLLYRAGELIERSEDNRTVADTGNLRERIGQLATNSPRWPATAFEPGPRTTPRRTPEALSEELAARDLATYDANLRGRLFAPTSDAVLRMSYRDGAFTASSAGADGNGGFMGYAPTPTAALDVLTTATYPHVPTLRLDPPQRAVRSPAEYVGQDVVSDLRREWFDALLDPLVPRMRQHLQACRERQAELAAVDLDEHLRQRSEHANTRTPQLTGDLDFLIYLDPPREPTLGHKGLPAFVHTVHWVPTSLVVHTSRTTRWGDFADAHPETLPTIAQDLRDTDDLEQFTDRLFTWSPILLDHIPGPAGPLHTLRTDGTHRTHLARLLELPFLLAEVTLHSLPLTFDLLAMVAGDPAGRPAEMISDKHLKNRLDLWRGLQRRGLIDGEADSSYHWTTTELRCRRLPAFWWLCSPAFATRVNTEYGRLYPGTLAAHGIPEQVGTNPDAWTRWLTR